MPYTKSGVDEQVVQSFMAALQLGLKKRFGGKVDHLRLVTQDVPGKDGGPRRYYVMLYDSVPGGTGYLHQLLAETAGTLSDVLRMALEALQTCACNSDPEKDGCYRCLYQYRLGRNMALVSRDRGVEVLKELVGSLDQLEKVSTISEIFINPSFDSVLESRFIECLRRMGGVEGLPTVKLVQDIVNGKSGFVMELAGQRYRIEPQCNLGFSDGVTVPSKPDFVIWPWQAGSVRQPIAVFCDGWTYHQHSLREDGLKRSALVASGKFWVWSVTHDDVKSALAGAVMTDMDSPLVTFNRHDGSSAPPGIPRANSGAFTYHSVAQLLVWLAKPVKSDDAVDPYLNQMQRNGLWLTYLMVPTSQTEMAQAKAEAVHMLQKLPTWMQPPASSHILSVSRASSQPKIVSSWPMSCIHGDLKDLSSQLVPGVIALDDLSEQAEEVRHLNWRRWLALFNSLQVLPGFQMTTYSAIDADDCNSLAPTSAKDELAAVSADQSAWAKEWPEAIASTVQVLQLGLKALSQKGILAPLVGYELADTKGNVVADAELAWTDQHIVVLRSDQADMQGVWVDAGWRILLVDDAGMGVDGSTDWVSAIGQMMNKIEDEGSSQ